MLVLYKHACQNHAVTFAYNTPFQINFYYLKSIPTALSEIKGHGRVGFVKKSSRILLEFKLRGRNRKHA